MAQQQSGASQGTEQPGIVPTQSGQMVAQQPRTPRAPSQAAFGSGGGAAIVFRDYASI